MKYPKITVITVSYNAEETIKDTIESVLNQTYNNIEYIIIDGASKDGTVEIIKSYENRFQEKGKSYKWISEPDNGIYDAMNKGIDIANGELIGIINSDDWYEKDAIEIILSIYNEKIEIYHGILKIWENAKEKYMICTNAEELKYGEMIEHPTCFVKKSVYKKIGNFDTKLKSSSDLDFMIKSYLNGVTFKYIEKLVANFRLGGISSNEKSIIETLDIKYKYKLITTKKYYLILLKTKIRKILKLLGVK